MSVKFYLTDNPLTPDPNDQSAVVTGSESYNEDAIIERMLRRGSAMTKADAKAVLQNFFTEISYIVEEGGSVNTSLFNAHPSISGKFADAADNFDKNRHKLNYNLSIGKTIQEALAKTKINKVATPDTGPIIVAIKDSVTGLADGTLSAGGVLEIIGSRLKIIIEADNNGVFFVPIAGGEAHKVATVVENKPSRLLVMIPALPAGVYMLEIRTNFSGSATPGKQLKTMQYGKPLSL